MQGLAAVLEGLQPAGSYATTAALAAVASSIPSVAGLASTGYVDAAVAAIEPGIPEGATLDALPDSSTRKAVTPAMEARIDASMQASPDATMVRFRGAIAGTPADLVAGDWWIDTTVMP